MTPRKRHIVLITTWFPPKNGVAVNRMTGFVKYLDKSYQDVTVITDFPSGLETELSEQYFGAKVHRIRVQKLLPSFRFKAGEARWIHFLKVLWNLSVKTVFGTTDKSWRRNALECIEQLHAQRPVDAIISSYAPASCHEIAADFIRNHPEIKWIADMRDEMSANVHLTKSERNYLATVEQSVNELASAVTSVSQPIVDDFKRVMPNVKHFREIRNGFDHELDFTYAFNPVFTISYAGTFYGRRKPDTFFRGLTLFLSRNPIHLKIRFIGSHRNFSIPPDCEKFCEFVPPLTSEDSVRAMAASDANLLILPVIESKGAFSGKIFEYLSVKKPVIAVVDPNDVAAELIREVQGGFVADFSSSEEIATAIEQAYNYWKERKPMNSDPVKVAQLHRRHSVAVLEQLLHSL